MSKHHHKALDDLLDHITVSEKAQHDEDAVNKWWPDAFPYSVETKTGVIALFMHEGDALRFRLDLINGLLNPVQSRRGRRK